jgi:hypothetical protein
MQRRNVVIAVGALVVLGLVGVGAGRLLMAKPAANATLVAAKPSTCDDAFRVLKLAPSMITAARPVCLVQSLVLSGELHGSVGQAYPVQADGVAATSLCTIPRRWDNFPQAMLAFVVGSKAYRLRITPSGYSEHQTVTVQNLQGAVELTSIADPNADWSQASGTLVLNGDGVSGTIDADLVRDVAGAKPVHVTGSWACGAPIATSAVAAVPCSLFYTLNHLQDSDVARMKAGACLAEDLTFSGAISAHLDHGVNDPAFPNGPGIDADNFCGATPAEYDASVKFSVGDETFLLVLNPKHYPAVGPGKYSSGTDKYTANAFLWLGAADPNKNGRFVSDENISWYGSQGSFTIAGDMKSGTIDETFNGIYSHPGSSVHLSGSWRCA